MEQTPTYGDTMGILRLNGHIWGSDSRNNARNNGPLREAGRGTIRLWTSDIRSQVPGIRYQEQIAGESYADPQTMRGNGERQ